MAGPFVELSSSLSRNPTSFAPFFGPLPLAPLAPLCAFRKMTVRDT